MNIQTKRGGVPMHSIILSSAAVLVPRSRRAEWLAGWNSELWYVLQSCDPSPRNLRSRESTLHGTRLARWNWSGLLQKKTVLFFSLGAFKDALWFRRNDCSPDSRRHLWLQSPLHCLLFLLVLAALSVFFFFRSSGPYEALMREARESRAVIFGYFLLVALAFLALPSTTSLAIGEYSAMPGSLSRAKRFERWAFLGIKLCLFISIIFCGTLDLAPVLGRLLPQFTLVAYFLAFRWALLDQRQRCPVCLRVLSNPIRIGQLSQIFLERSGTEYLCLNGHGSLYVPEILTTFSAQYWSDQKQSCGNGLS
ncbi:MAG TPA: hypothetical protein VKR82_00240 [Candidatus Acidoferrales bacterium]|nr:hypothetical protein [Candidatus Acidoferrales bacterium]